MRLSGLIAALLLSLGSCSREKLTPGMAIPIQRLVPEGTTSIADVRLTQLLKTGMYERWLAARVARQLNEFTEATGLDPRKDISEFAVAMSGGEAVLLVEGRFDPADIEKRLTARGSKATEANGIKLWSSGQGALALPSRNAAVIGPEALVKSALASKGLPPALAALLPEVATGAQIWAISTADFKNFRAPERSNLQNLEKMIGGVDAVAASADLRFGLQFRATGFCATPEDAGKLQTAIRGGMGFLRLSATPEMQPVMKALDGVIVKPEGKLLRFAIDLTPEQVDAVQSLVPMLGR